MTTWITRRPEAEVEADRAAIDPAAPLAGRRLAVKDNIDVAGLPTTVACPAYAYRPTCSAPVVDRLVAAGAVVVGKTNLDQFATGLVGTRTPYGPPVNPLAPDHVPGGSSSGSAVAVATDEADIALGTDTAGSGRVPAAFCGIVGLKPTPGWLSTRGVVPACASLDCVSVFARDVATAATAVLAAAGEDDDDPWSRPAPPDAADPPPVRRLAVPTADLAALGCDAPTLAAWQSLLDRLPGLGFELVPWDPAPYLEAGRLLYGGALVAERYAAVGAFVDAHPDEVDPTVGAIIHAAGQLTAPALAADLARLALLRRRAATVWRTADAVVLPTTPTHPTRADVAAEPIAVNAALGTFTNGCNLVGWCAAAVPGGTRPDGLPFGISLLGPAWHDQAVWVAAANVAGHDPPPRAATPGPPDGRP